ncbi:MAG: integrase family protein [gamma proteobacterium symbiont of Taylorina sp.]|nr:integrase family protein [gamma proteobacterium symbiont of Taylorina sp.]
MSKKIISPANGFTDTFLKNLKVIPDNDLFISDKGCKGLRLKISKAGTKSFVTTIKCNGVRYANISLGQYPNTSLSDAREKRIKWKSEATDGSFIPPKKQKELEEKAKLEREAKLKSKTLTLGTVMDEHKELVVMPRRSWKSTVSMIDCYIRGVGKVVPPPIILADISIRSVTKSNVQEIIFSIRDDKPGVVIELFDFLIRFFNWSIRQGYLDKSPIVASDKKDWKLIKQPKGDFALDIDNQGRIVTALPEIKHFFTILDSEYSKKVALPLKILLLTGVRSGELMLAKKEHIDFDRMEWFIPKENTKSYRPEKNIDTSIIVPLAPYTATLFRELIEISDTDSVATVAKNTLPWAVKAIVTKHGFKRFTPHTLRKTLRSHIITWTRYEVAEKCLNHSLGQLESVYDRSMLDERREALTIWSDKVYRAVYGTESNVVPLRG